MTESDRIKIAQLILNSDDAFEADCVTLDLFNINASSERELKLAHVVSALYKLIHPAGGCPHPDWDEESLKLSEEIK